MGEKKPVAKLLLHIVQLVILLSLIQAVNTQTWYTGVVDLEYTEGLPKEAGLEVELEVDQKSSDGSIHVDGFLTWLNWQNARNDTSIPSESVEKEEDSWDATPLSEVQENVPMLTNAAAALAFILLVLTYFEIKNRFLIGLILNGLVLWIIISLAILAPLGYFGGMDFGTGSQEEKRETSVHQDMKLDSGIDIFSGGINLEFESEGYDLGLVDESELDAVIANAPGEDHRSFYAIDGNAGIQLGTFIIQLAWAWLVLFFTAPILIGFTNLVRTEKPQRLGPVESNGNLIVIVNED